MELSLREMFTLYASFFFTDTAMGRDAAITPPRNPNPRKPREGRVGKTEITVPTALTWQTHEKGIHTKSTIPRRETARLGAQVPRTSEFMIVCLGNSQGLQ